MTIYDAISIAREHYNGSILTQKAQVVCQARSQYPFEQVFVNGYLIDRWQAVLVEAMLMEDIRQEIMTG